MPPGIARPPAWRPVVYYPAQAAVSVSVASGSAWFLKGCEMAFWASRRWGLGVRTVATGLIAAVLVVIAAVIVITGRSASAKPSPVDAFSVNRKVPNLRLLDEHGHTVSLNDFRGKVRRAHAVSDAVPRGLPAHHRRVSPDGARDPRGRIGEPRRAHRGERRPVARLTAAAAPLRPADAPDVSPAHRHATGRFRRFGSSSRSPIGGCPKPGSRTSTRSPTNRSRSMCSTPTACTSSIPRAASVC